MTADRTKTILAFGDSLTWGSDPVTSDRHPRAARWPNAMAAELGDGFDVVTDGLRGRTTAWDDHLGEGDRNGARLLPTILATHAPVDLVIIMLGTNDMKPQMAGQAMGASKGMRRLAEIVLFGRQSMNRPPEAQVLLVSPPPLVPTQNEDFAAMFTDGVAESRDLARLYRRQADELGCAFFDAGTVAKTSPADGVHLDAENTAAIGRALAPIARSMLSDAAN